MPIFLSFSLSSVCPCITVIVCLDCASNKAETATCIGRSARLIDRSQTVFPFIVRTKRLFFYFFYFFFFILLPIIHSFFVYLLTVYRLFILSKLSDAARQLDLFGTKSNACLVIDGPSLQVNPHNSLLQALIFFIFFI